jgi:hypothetical protein
MAAAAWAQSPNPDLPKLIETIRAGVQPDRAMNTMRDVYASDRWFTFPQFEITAEYLRGRMKEAGLAGVEVVGAPADGVTQVGFWTMPRAWDAKSARLEILDDSLPAGDRILAEYQQVPASLGMWSGSTPPEGVVAEVVRVKAGDLVRADLHGKLGLTDVNPANIKWELVKAGALGAINTFTENPSLENGRQWINAWGDSGWAFTRTSTPLLSFSITPQQTRLLDKLLARGTVRVKATVDARYYDGKYPYVTGVIPGTGSEEVLTLGHTSEQGAEDNATGVAATLEALTVLNRLITAGSLPRPKRSIRILSMGEMYGSMHYVAHNRERVQRTVAAMCVDTPAASYSIAGTEYTFYMNPHVAKDFTDALILKVAADYFPTVHRPWHEKPFTTGTDTYMAEPMVGIPTVWGYSGSGVETHHNSEDTPDRVDPNSLRDITIVDAAFLYFVANAGQLEAKWLAALSETRGYEQILRAAQPFFDAPPHTPPRLEQAREALTYAAGREQQSVMSVLRLLPENARVGAQRQLQDAADRLQEFAVVQFARVRAASRGLEPAAAPVESGPASHIVVKRKRFGTIPLDDLPHDQWEGQPSGAWDAVPTIALYWCDGHRSLAEVAKLTNLELGPTGFDFVSYFRFLRRHGYVDFR